MIEQDVEIGAFCRLEPYVYVKRWTTLGERNQISAGTALGTDPLDKNFTGERSYLRIGNDNIIREHYTVSRGTQPESVTDDRRRQLHHDVRPHRAQLHDRKPVRDCELRVDGGLRGGGGPGLHFRRRGVHQYSKVGRLAMMGGNTGVNTDLPPFFLYSDYQVTAERSQPGGPAQGRIHPRRGRNAQERLQASLSFESETGGCAAAHRDGIGQRAYAAPGALCPIQQTRDLPPMSADLERKLGFLDALAIVVGMIIGGGIFVVPNLVARSLDSRGAILSLWILAGVVSFFGALASAELGAAIPATGGQYVSFRRHGPAAAGLRGRMRGQHGDDPDSRPCPRRAARLHEDPRAWESITLTCGMRLPG